MAAPVGNKNATGSTGGYNYSKEYREMQIKLKQLAIVRSLEILEHGTFDGLTVTKRERMDVMNNVLKSALPRELEVGGEGMGPIEFIIKRGHATTRDTIVDTPQESGTDH